jgi:hypothetical protein
LTIAAGERVGGGGRDEKAPQRAGIEAAIRHDLSNARVEAINTKSD